MPARRERSGGIRHRHGCGVSASPPGWVMVTRRAVDGDGEVVDIGREHKTGKRSSARRTRHSRAARASRGRRRRGMSTSWSPATGSVTVTGFVAPGRSVESEEWVASSWLRAKPMAIGRSLTCGAMTTFSIEPSARAAICSGCFSVMRSTLTPSAEEASTASGKSRSAVFSFTASSGAAPCSTIHAVRPRTNTAEPRLAAPAKVRIAPSWMSWPLASAVAGAAGCGTAGAGSGVVGAVTAAVCAGAGVGAGAAAGAGVAGLAGAAGVDAGCAGLFASASCCAVLAMAAACALVTAEGFAGDAPASLGDDRLLGARRVIGGGRRCGRQHVDHDLVAVAKVVEARSPGRCRTPPAWCVRRS